MERIASLARVVRDNPEPDELASHLALRILGHLDCRALVIGIIQKEGFLDLIGNYGLTEKTTAPYKSMPLWTQVPMTEAARTGKLIFIKGYQDLIERFPSMANALEHKDLITIAMPLIYRSAIIGSIAFSSTKAPKEDFTNNPLTDAALALVGLYIKNFRESKRQLGREDSRVINSLSERQRKIISLFREGLTTEQMADRLRFSASTIKQDIIKIYDLFDVNSREQVVILAERAGLLNPSNAS